MGEEDFVFMELLDWNNDENDQIRGREIAKTVSDLSVFMQPMTEKINKNVWDNCAIILSEKSDKELEPYLISLMEWIQDINWPGAMIIMNRLRSFSDPSSVLKIREKCIEQAKTNNDEVWLTNMMNITL